MADDRLDWEVRAADAAAVFRFDHGSTDLDLPGSFFHGWDDQRGHAALFRGRTSDLHAYNAGRLAWLIYEGMR